MKWHFFPHPPRFVETGVTQRDQFRNDEVDLFETIVRESIQNSLDATINGNQTRVVFKWVNSGHGLDSVYLNNIFSDQLEHAKCSELDIDTVNFDAPTALVIEDFGTKGLTGSTIETDDDNFSDFWRRHGKSHKTGTSRGRWGLGKLVYSSSSRIGAFLGLTSRKTDPENQYLMGQTVLDLRRCDDGKTYPPHAYYSDLKGEDIEEQVQVPSTDPSIIEEFRQQFSITRKDESGLSIVIPFPHEGIRPEGLIEVCIANYFYPILTGQLVIDVNGQEINTANIRELAHTYSHRKISDIDELFDFITEANKAIVEDNLITLKKGWIDDVRLDEDDFEPDDVETIRNTFSEGKLVGVRLPLSIKDKSEKDPTTKKPIIKEIDTEFYVFVKRPENITRGQDLYVRGGLTLPAESKFGERKAFGAMIADEAVISAFLGDAENPAHTKWIFNAEKLRNNYVAPGDKLRVIKFSLLNFYDMLVQAEEEIDEKALIKFFFSELPEQPGKKPNKPTETPDTPEGLPKRKPKIARIATTKDGFSINRGDGADDAEFPQRFRVRAAYDTTSGNPFKKYHPMDFDFSKDIKLQATKESVKILSGSKNEIVFEITSPKFQIHANGFDSNRDLIVKLKSDIMGEA